MLFVKMLVADHLAAGIGIIPGKIPAFKEGDVWKFERAKIDHWAASGKVKT